MSYKGQHAARDVNEEVLVKNVATFGSDADTYLHVLNPSTKSEHDPAICHSSYSNLTNTGSHDHFNLNPDAGGSTREGIVRSLENVARQQLPSASSSASSSLPALSVGGGVTSNPFLCSATALTPLPLPAMSHSRFHIGHDDIATTAAAASKQPEKPVSFQSPHVPSVDHDQVFASTPAGTQVGARTATGTSSKAFDVYEFCDEDDDEFTKGISLRGRKPSRSLPVSNSADPHPSSHVPLYSAHQQTSNYDFMKKRHSTSEADAGMMSAPQNVATIFDMDSRLIHRVKTEPGSLTALVSDYVPFSQSADGQRKLSLPRDDANCKRLRLSNDTGGYVGLENVGTSIHDMISNVRKTSECGGGMMTFDKWHPNPFSLRPANFMPQSLPSPVGNVEYPDRKPSVKLLDVSAQRQHMNTSEVVKRENDRPSSVPGHQFSAPSPSAWLFNWNATAASSNASSIIRSSQPVPVIGQSVHPSYAGFGHHMYGIPQLNTMSTTRQAGIHWEDKNMYDSSIHWRNMALNNHSTAIQSSRVGQNTFGNVSSKVLKTDVDNVRRDSLSSVLDLSPNNSQMSTSTSHVTRGHSFRLRLPHAAAASRCKASHAQKTVTDSSSPHPLRFSHHSRHHQLEHQQHQQQLGLCVKKEDVKEEVKMTDEEKLLNRLKCNLVEEVPRCQCKGSYDESVEGPYYTHLGIGPSEAAIRQLIEQRLDISGRALRIEKLLCTGKEGKSMQGCPIAKWIIRRSGAEEKVLVLTRRRRGHRCQHAVQVVGICVWDGIEQQYATQLYDYLCQLLPDNAEPTERRCGWNERKTCACQGWSDKTGGASFSFGCSWSMYYNACKFARSDAPRKFRLRDRSKELRLDDVLQSLATHVAPIYRRVAPDAYYNQVHFEAEGSSCRIGHKPGRPWSGVTAVVDFCTHAHKDTNNMNNGCTTVLTLTKHRGNRQQADDEQLHVLPLCILDSSDEFGNTEAQRRKVADGSIECLREYPMITRLHRQPVMCKKKRIKMAALARAAAGIVSRRGRGKSSLSLAAASALRTATHCRTTSARRGRGLKHPAHGLTKLPPGGLSEPDWSLHQPRASSYQDNTIQSYIDDFQRLSYIAPIPKSSLLMQSYPRTQFHSPLSYKSLFPLYSAEATGVHDGRHLGLLSGSTSKPTACTYAQTLQASDDRNGRELSGYLNLMAGGTTLQHGVQQHSGVQHHHLYDPAAVFTSDAVCGYNMLSSSAGSSNAQSNSRLSDKMTTSLTSSHNSKCHTVSRLSVADSQTSVHGCSMSDFISVARDVKLPMIDVGNSSPADVHLAYQQSVGVDAEGMRQRLPVELMSTPAADAVDKGAVEEDATPLEIFYDNTENFRDSEIGGVALALSHGSILFEVAKRELHATTALKNPSRAEPTRISLVFYQHRNLNAANHGRRVFEQRAEDRRQAQSAAADIKTSLPEPTTLTVGHHFLQGGTMQDSSHMLQTQFAIVRQLLPDSPVTGDQPESSVDWPQGLCTVTSPAGSSSGAEIMKISMPVPTADELAEIDLGDQ